MRKVNRYTFKKWNNFKLGKERLVAKYEESIRSMNELRVEKEPVYDVVVKSLMSDLEKLNAKLRAFSNISKNIDNMMCLNKITRNRGVLCFNNKI